MSQDKAGRSAEQNRTHHPPQGITYVLMIGIDAYVHCPHLYNCVKDAHDLIELLTERYPFERGNMREIFNSEATRGNIYNAFRDMAQRVTPNDNLLYERYLRAYPDGHYTRLALEAQATIEVEEAWQRTTRRNTIPAYREFFGMYPSSRYAAEAEARIEKLLNLSNRVRTQGANTTTPVASPLPRPKQPRNYKPYSLGIVGILVILVGIWIWSSVNGNRNSPATETEENADTTAAHIPLEDTTTLLPPPETEKKKEQVPKKTERAADQPKTTANNKTTKTETKKEADTKTPPVETEIKKKESPPAVTIDGARIKQLLTDAKASLQSEETEEAKKMLGEGSAAAG